MRRVLILRLALELSSICCDIQMCFSKSGLDFPPKSSFSFSHRAPGKVNITYKHQNGPVVGHRYQCEYCIYLGLRVLLKDTSAGELKCFFEDQWGASARGTACNEQRSAKLKNREQFPLKKKKMY